MKTLIFNGSPRPDGDTAALLRAFLETLAGEYAVIDAYRARISPCVDCRACREKFACAVEDDMQAVYRALCESDCVVIATPIYYTQPTGRLMDVMSRLQPGFYARLRGETGFQNRLRRGGILLSGGGSGSPEPALRTARMLLRAMNARDIAPAVIAGHTDTLPAAQDEQALHAARALGEALSQSSAVKIINTPKSD